MGYRTVAVIQRPAGGVRPNGLCLSCLCITWEKAIVAPFNVGNPDNEFVFFYKFNLLFFDYFLFWIKRMSALYKNEGVRPNVRQHDFRETGAGQRGIFNVG